MNNKILLAHGAGGKLSHNLITQCFMKYFPSSILSKLDDSAVFQLNGKVAFTTDSYVVNPIFFPGGNIGKLAVCGTVNDLATSGAQPLYLSVSLIIEEGLAEDDLQEIVKSIQETAKEAEVEIVTGDTKVVNHGSADKLFVNTAGIGIISPGVNISGSYACPGDKIIISGTIGDHGIAIMSKREELNFSTKLISDCAPLGNLVQAILKVCPDVHVLRDPTRGGLATTLNELAKQSNVSINIEEQYIPIRGEVQGACELLGLDPLYIANEGKMIVIVPPACAEKVLAALQAHRYGKDAVVIGEVNSGHSGKVFMKTILGTSRIIDMLVGDPLPRIC